MFCGLFSEIILPSVYALLLSVFVLQLTFCRSLGQFCLHFCIHRILREWRGIVRPVPGYGLAARKAKILTV